ncbi:STAS domain-containing protein [Umezawaea sp.]|uniref:STAS domain-containing protein n=1 Tax=Umezawaea sp. TaxID=1955258 RepID=UPI002ED4397C
MPRNSAQDARSGDERSTPLRVATEDLASALVLRVAGEIDMNTAPAFGEHMAAAFAAASAAQDRSRPAVVVDFSEVDFLASVGLSVLVAHHQLGEANGTPMLLVVSSRAVLRSIASAQLDQLFTLHPTVEEALGAASAH